MVARNVFDHFILHLQSLLLQLCYHGDSLGSQLLNGFGGMG